MTRHRSRGFTLIEILLVVGLVGVIAATAIAPLIFTVESLQDAQRSWGESGRERAAAERIFADVRGAVESPAFQSVKIVHKEGLSAQKDDRIMIWSSSPTKEGGPVSLVVYRVVVPSALDNQKGGLYRWVVKGARSESKSDINKSILSTDVSDGKRGASGDIKQTLSAASDKKDETPMDLDTDTLKPEDGRLLLPGADGLKLQAALGKEWTDDYEGFTPPAMRIEITVKDRTYSHEEWFPTTVSQR